MAMIFYNDYNDFTYFFVQFNSKLFLLPGTELIWQNITFILTFNLWEI